ncbi:hypothetical protein SK128_020040, partial [Halocaridina rubra]
MDDIDGVTNLYSPYGNITNTTALDNGVTQDESNFLTESDTHIYVAAAIFSLCYFLVGVTCCRCYWLHLRKKSETNRSIEGGLDAVVVSKKEEGKERKEKNGDEENSND